MINKNILITCFCLGLGGSSLSLAEDVGASIGLKNKSFYYHLESCRSSDQSEVYISHNNKKNNTGLIYNLEYIDQTQLSYKSGYKSLDISKFGIGTSFFNNCGVDHDKDCYLGSRREYKFIINSTQLFNPRYKPELLVEMYGNYVYFDIKGNYYIPRDKSDVVIYQNKTLLSTSHMFDQKPYGYRKFNGIIKKGGEFSMSYRQVLSDDKIFQNIECNVVKNVENIVVGVFGVALQPYDAKGIIPAGISYSPYLNVPNAYNLIYREDLNDRHNGEDSFVSYSLNDKQVVSS